MSFDSRKINACESVLKHFSQKILERANLNQFFSRALSDVFRVFEL